MYIMNELILSRAFLPAILVIFLGLGMSMGSPMGLASLRRSSYNTLSKGRT
jgi:hypothetical protein